MKPAPYTSYALVDALHRLPDSLQFLSTGIAQYLSLLQNLFLLHVLDAHDDLLAVDVVAPDDWVMIRSWCNMNLDLGILFGEGG